MELFDILAFESTVVENVPIDTTEPDFVTVITHQRTGLALGDYKLTFSMRFNHHTTSQSFLYRFSLDGGATWGLTYEKEVKERNNSEVIEVINVLKGIQGDLDVRLQCSREGTATCTVEKAFISSERKK